MWSILVWQYWGGALYLSKISGISGRALYLGGEPYIWGVNKTKCNTNKKDASKIYYQNWSKHSKEKYKMNTRCKFHTTSMTFRPLKPASSVQTTNTGMILRWKYPRHDTIQNFISFFEHLAIVRGCHRRICCGGPARGRLPAVTVAAAATCFVASRLHCLVYLNTYFLSKPQLLEWEENKGKRSCGKKSLEVVFVGRSG